jgi:hypothetical protein
VKITRRRSKSKVPNAANTCPMLQRFSI